MVRVINFRRGRIFNRPLSVQLCMIRQILSLLMWDSQFEILHLKVNCYSSSNVVLHGHSIYREKGVVKISLIQLALVVKNPFTQFDL